MFALSYSNISKHAVCHLLGNWEAQNHLSKTYWLLQSAEPWDFFQICYINIHLQKTDSIIINYDATNLFIYLFYKQTAYYWA